MGLRNYAIYGEEVHEVDPGFAHVEKVSDRGVLHKGVVDTHTHPYLHQLSLWQNGHGTYQLEDHSHSLQGTMLTWVPSSTLHGFTIHGSCDAFVVSVSDEFLQSELTGAALMPQGLNWREPAVMTVPDALAPRIAAMFEDVADEYAAARAFRQQALASRIKLVFIEFARLAQTRLQASTRQGVAALPAFPGRTRSP
jgi:AraC family transcriptional activator of pobA